MKPSADSTKMKSLTVIHFSNVFQTNVEEADIYFSGVRNCEYSSTGKYDIWGNNSNRWWWEGSAAM